MSVTLSIEMLDEFNARLRSLGAGLADSWAPGVSDTRIDELFLPLEINLPEEARIWWRWHNGTRDGVPAVHRQFYRYSVASIESAADLYRRVLPDALELWGQDKLLEPMVSTPHLLFDCGGASDEPVPIRMQNDLEDPEIVLLSIGELVKLWIELTDLGVWQSTADGWLDIVEANIPPEIRPLGIV